MSYEPLMEAVVQVLVFLELSGSEIVDEDAAVGLMEEIAAVLQRLEPAEKREFVEYLRRRARRTGTESDEALACIRNLPANLGLAAD
jgi:hypothetical protein